MSFDLFDIALPDHDAKQAQAVPLHTSEIAPYWLAAIVESADDAIISKTLDGIITSWNKGAERIFGYRPEEVIGKSITILIPADRSDEEPSILARLRRGERIEHYETVRVRKDGTLINISLTVSPIRNAEGKIIGASKIARDITERKRAEEKLLEAERRATRDYQELLSRIAPLAQTLGTARDLTAIYRAILKFIRLEMPCVGFFVSFYDAEKDERTAAYGWAHTDGEIDISTLPPMPLKGATGPNARAVHEGKTIIIDGYQEVLAANPRALVVGKNDDGRRPDSSAVAPMIVMNRIIGTLEVQAYEKAAYKQEHIIVLELVANLTAVAIENVWLLSVEAKARREAEAANRLKDEFLATVSHELRTPLTAILGWVQMLRAGQLTPAGAARSLAIVERNAQAQKQIIEDLLDVSRIITGKLKLNLRLIDPVTFIEAALEAVRPAAEAKGVRLEKSVDASINAVSGDPERLQQVAWNLLSNAIKFTPRGGRVHVRLEAIDSHVGITVSDTGVGISPEFLPHVFDRFRQADSSTTRAHGGLGLGLAIVRHLVELHGGTVEANSQGAGQGATFTVKLPLIPLYDREAAEDEGQPEASDSLPMPFECLDRLDGLKVLIVDDEPDTCELLKMLLSRCGAEVVTAMSAAAALAELKGARFDLLISDIGMPEVDGYQLIRQVRQLPAERGGKTPAVALTAYARAEDRLRALRSGFQMHVPKPVEPAELLAVMASLAGREMTSETKDEKR